MDIAKAKRIISKHGAGYLDVNDESECSDNLIDTLHECGEVKNEYFQEIIEALFIISDELSQNETVDRKLIHSLWYMCHMLRATIKNGCDPTFHNKTSIPNKDILTIWTTIIDSIILDLLHGLSREDTFMIIASYNEAYKLDLKWSFLIPIYIKILENSVNCEEIDFLDDEINICKYISGLKEKALAAIPILKKIANSHKSQELKEIAKKTIISLQQSGRLD
ncbi:hypothetical protein DENIS_4451 [Desulfonema ishimotonii]|uniref:Uncharacterized protein n=1 Tax=Desulfonema ishimotonii TaxID=45657 RepID=A0A401G2K2_9BACT|nr:hypothetical protein [Desulfonema ishimotonii]GBC63457.1 hypothetical protein DENIS_4451 [Desulfonema ishimotonii]